MAYVWIYPRVRPEADGFGNGKENASVPVNNDEDVEHEVADTENVRIVRSGFRAVEELKETCHFEEAIEPKFRIVKSHFQHYKICGDH